MNRTDIIVQNMILALKIWQHLNEQEQRFVLSCNKRKALPTHDFNKLHSIVNPERYRAGIATKKIHKGIE